MEAIYKLKTNELNERFIKTIKELFKGKSISITISSDIDETDYLSENEANLKHLEKNINSEKKTVFKDKQFSDFVHKSLQE
jgi:hypothetical protein